MHSLLRSRLPRLPFRRKPDFDPKTDPIVRVQVYRLTQKLKEYYELEGAQESILVEIPKGDYLPKFEVLQPPGFEPAPGGGAATKCWRSTSFLSKPAFFPSLLSPYINPAESLGLYALRYAGLC